MNLFRATLLALVASLATASISVGDRLPSIELDLGFPPEKVDVAARVAGKKTILVGLPGAFTPT